MASMMTEEALWYFLKDESVLGQKNYIRQKVSRVLGDRSKLKETNKIAV
jgi:hypothetical protein